MGANADIKTAMRVAGVHFWRVAECLGLNDGNFSRLLRKELPRERKEQIFAIIEDLAQSGLQEAVAQ
jgi:hypothetical protein